MSNIKKAVTNPELYLVLWLVFMPWEVGVVTVAILYLAQGELMPDARRPTVAERDNLMSRIDMLKEALWGLLKLKQMEDERQTSPNMSSSWRAAWANARSALNEERLKE